MSDVRTLDRHIEVTAEVAGGKPRIAGRRITVQNIVVWHEYMGIGADQIAAEYDLSLSEVYAALAYYFDHREEIQQQIDSDETFAEALRSQTPDTLSSKLK